MAGYKVQRVKGTHSPKIGGMKADIEPFSLENTKPVKIKKRGGRKK